MQQIENDKPKHHKVWTVKKKGLILFLSTLVAGIIAIVSFDLTPASGYCSNDPSLIYAMEYYTLGAIMLAVPIPYWHRRVLIFVIR